MMHDPAGQPAIESVGQQAAQQVLLRKLPGVDRLLEMPAMKSLSNRFSHAQQVAAARTVVEELRRRVMQQQLTSADELNDANVARRAVERLERQDQRRLRRVINATGIVLHTGLGRAPLAESAVAELANIAGRYSNVELDLNSGERGDRGSTVVPVLCELTGAESALVVNNNSAATVLTLAAIAASREVVVSRGELVEIGGSFRLPDVMSASGAILREVGTTNKTRIDDYRQVIHPATAALMKVHTSNYRVVGFTAAPSLSEMVGLAREFDVPMIHDIGSGALVDLSAYGLHDEPLAAVSIRTGADLVLFSSDKMLGGPQCGIILGRRRWIDRLRKHPLMRAFRVDKLTLSALAATLELYRRPETLERLPLIRLLGVPLEQLRERAERMAERVAASPQVHSAEAIQATTYLGGGSVPTQQLDTWCVAIQPQRIGLDEFARRLRTATPGVVSRVQQDRLLLDLRSVFADEDEEIAKVISAIA